MIEIKEVSYSYDYKEDTFSNLSLSIKTGEFWGVLGKNGAGKSTLLDLITGFKAPTNGMISINGKDTIGADRSFQKSISYISQDIEFDSGRTIEELLNFHAPFFETYSVEKEKELLDYMELDKSKKVEELSLGQRKKIQIVAGIASCTDFILIDEVTAVLDPEARHKFFNLLDSLKKEGKGIVLATNISEDLETRVDNVLLIKNDSHKVVSPDKIKGFFNINE